MVDIYTKSVLTVIAAALVTMVAQQAIRPSAAQIGGTQRVQICDALSHCLAMAQVDRALHGQPYGTYTTYALPTHQEPD